MAPRVGHEMSRGTVMGRRERIAAMTERGFTAREIARELSISPRQVQRHQRGHRLGTPVGKQGRS